MKLHEIIKVPLTGFEIKLIRELFEQTRKKTLCKYQFMYETVIEQFNEIKIEE